jgi:hypothetical protein
MVLSELTTVAPWMGLAKRLDPAMALIQASEMDRLGPGPVTPSWILPMAADVVVDRPVVAPDAVDAVVAPADVEAPVPDVPVVEDPLNDWTSAPGGVMEIRFPRARGQSTAEPSTEARRATPAE